MEFLDMLGYRIDVGDVVVNTASNARSYDVGRVVGFTEHKVKVQVMRSDWSRDMEENDPRDSYVGRISYANPSRMAIHVHSAFEQLANDFDIKEG